MHALPSRPLLWVCLILCITQAVIVDARSSRKDRKKIEEENAPNPVVEEETADPAEIDRDARQPTEELDEGVAPSVDPVNDRENHDGDGSERTKKSYCASERSSDGNYNAGEHPHGPSGHGHGPPGPYGRYHNEADQYHGPGHSGGHGPGYGPSHPSGYGQHGPDMTDYHHPSGPSHGPYGRPEGHGEGGKGHPGYARKSGGDYADGGQGGKGGGEMYHPAASASAAVYRPSYQTGQEGYGGGGGADYSPSYGHGAGHGHPYGAAPSAGGHGYPVHQEAGYPAHAYGVQSPGYGAGHAKAGYGGAAYPHAPSYGPPAYGQSVHPYGGAAPAYGQLYHSPSGYPPSNYPSAGYPSHGPYAPAYMPYHSPTPSYQYAPSYPSPLYPQHYGYGPPPSGYHPTSAYQMMGPQGIPVTLTCSLQPHDGPIDYHSQSRGGPAYYRASDGDSNSSKAPLTVVVVPPSQNKTTKPTEKQPGKEQQKDQPTHAGGPHEEVKEHTQPAMAQQSMAQGMSGGPQRGMQMGGGAVAAHQSARESASYQQLPFSVVRQRQMENFLGPKPVFYQREY